jgi:two-component system OmpR family response regulator
MRILLIEDDENLSTALTRALAQAAHAVDNVANGEDALDALQNDVYDLVILDIGLPKLDGFEVLRVLRARSLHVPVLILTARDALEDRVKGLDLGADDYLTKPFDLPEFEARVRALVRRGHRSTSAQLRHGRIRLDTAGRRLYCEDDVPIDLSLRELALIEVLMLREGRVVTKEQMVDHLYGWREEVGTNAIEVYIHRLRRKLEPVGVNIRTVRGMGYLLDKANGR